MAGGQREREARPHRLSGGIERDTLPPIGNAPVDQDYGRPRAGEAPRRAFGGPAGAGGYGAGEGRGTGHHLPAQLWRGMGFERFRDAVLKIRGVGGSLVLNNLFVEALLDPSTRFPRADPQTLDLLKMVVLYRMGRVRELLAHIKAIPENQRSLPVRVFEARAFLANGDFPRACALATRFPVGDPQLSHDLLSEALLMTALCAGQRKDLQTVGLMADLARDKGVRSPLSFAVMDYLLSGAMPHIAPPGQIGVRDYFFLRLTGSKIPRKLLQRAEPALVHALAMDRSTSSALRLDAAEQAALGGQIDAAALAAIYTDVTADGSLKRVRHHTDSETRALLFDGLSRTNDPHLQARIMDTLLANVRRVHLATTIGPMLAPYVQRLQPAPDLAWFAARAVEVALLSGDRTLAERWLSFARQGGRQAYEAAEWLPLASLLQPDLVPFSDGTQMALRMARAHGLGPRALHGLTSVMNALGFDVPIPLWNEASKRSQPKKGVLPATGVLGLLRKYSDEGRAGEVLLTSLQAVGSHAPDEMHLLALTDLVKSLKKAGFDDVAGQFGFQALYGIWPTGARRSR